MTKSVPRFSNTFFARVCVKHVYLYLHMYERRTLARKSNRVSAEERVRRRWLVDDKQIFSILSPEKRALTESVCVSSSWWGDYVLESA